METDSSHAPSSAPRWGHPSHSSNHMPGSRSSAAEKRFKSFSHPYLYSNRRLPFSDQQTRPKRIARLSIAKAFSHRAAHSHIRQRFNKPFPKFLVLTLSSSFWGPNVSIHTVFRPMTGLCLPMEISTRADFCRRSNFTELTRCLIFAQSLTSLTVLLRDNIVDLHGLCYLWLL